MLVVLLVFGAVSAFGGAVLGIVFNGSGVPLEHLAGTPFSSFVVPGLILGVVVGGTQLAAGVALLARNQWAPLMAAVAGFAMMIWIYTELAINVPIATLAVATSAVLWRLLHGVDPPVSPGGNGPWKPRPSERSSSPEPR